MQLLLEAFNTDVVQASVFFYQVAADFLIAVSSSAFVVSQYFLQTTVMSECGAAVGVQKETADDDFADAQAQITIVLRAFRQALKCYQKEYLVECFSLPR